MTELERIENELRLAGYKLEPVTNEEWTDDDYVQSVGNSVYETLKTFISHDHSGLSAQCAIIMITRLLHGGTLTPITNDPSEWINCSNYYKEEYKEGVGLWQSKRDTSCFSDDNLKTYYDIDEEANKVYELDENGNKTDWCFLKPREQMVRYILKSKEELQAERK